MNHAPAEVSVIIPAYRDREARRAGLDPGRIEGPWFS